MSEIQEIRGQIEKQLAQYHEYFVYENRGNYITGIHQDREMAYEIMTDLYRLVCAIGGLDRQKQKEERQ